MLPSEPRALSPLCRSDYGRFLRWTPESSQDSFCAGIKWVAPWTGSLRPSWGDISPTSIAFTVSVRDLRKPSPLTSLRLHMPYRGFHFGEGKGPLAISQESPSGKVTQASGPTPSLYLACTGHCPRICYVLGVGFRCHQSKNQPGSDAWEFKLQNGEPCGKQVC